MNKKLITFLIVVLSMSLFILPISFVNAKKVKVEAELVFNGTDPDGYGEYFSLYITNTGGSPINEVSIRLKDPFFENTILIVPQWAGWETVQIDESRASWTALSKEYMLTKADGSFWFPIYLDYIEVTLEWEAKGTSGNVLGEGVLFYP